MFISHDALIAHVKKTLGGDPMRYYALCDFIQTFENTSENRSNMTAALAVFGIGFEDAQGLCDLYM